MSNCEACGKSNSGDYGSGRFCCVKCARAFSTLKSRAQINEKVSAKLMGREPSNKGSSFKLSEEVLLKRKTAAEDRWKSGPWDKVPLKKRRLRILLEQGGVCNICKMSPIWCGRPLQFDLDHKSGDRSDNSRQNLQMICPNCHRQTPNWGSKNASVEGRMRMINAGRRKS